MKQNTPINSLLMGGFTSLPCQTVIITEFTKDEKNNISSIRTIHNHKGPTANPAPNNNISNCISFIHLVLTGVYTKNNILIIGETTSQTAYRPFINMSSRPLLNSGTSLAGNMALTQHNTPNIVSIKLMKNILSPVATIIIK
jgi:hypothetical protein